MKTRTIIRMTILLAVTAIFGSCSNEESAVDNPVVKSPTSGIPFVVNVENNGATRGSAISTISAFKMVGIQGTSNKWIDNYLFTKPGDSWVASGHENLTWPSGTSTSTFYAVSDNSDGAPDITNGKFTYTVPATIKDQKDLLVSLSEDNESGTPVTLSFMHALSSVKFKIGFNEDEPGGDKDTHLKVTKIKLYHIATKGTFDFTDYAATNPWTVDPDDAEYKDFEITLKEPIEFVPSAFADFKEIDGNYIDETSIGEIYVMPHKPTPWDTDGTAGNPLNNSYIGITCQVFEYTGNTYRDIAGLDENSNEEKYENAKLNYLVNYWGKASTDDDSWLEDKQISVIVPTNDDYKMDVLFESILNYRNEEAAANGVFNNYEEVYIPLEMKNGFGFGKNNIINIRMDKMKYSNGKSFYQSSNPIINP